MKKVVTLTLAVFLLLPGAVRSADRNSAQAAATVATAVPVQKVDLNRASVKELVEVPGIGSRMAQAIVDLRSKKGAFTRVEELLEVRGIKEKKLAAIAAHLVLLPVPPSAQAAAASLSR